MTFQYIQFQTDERGVATLTLDRADKHNALNADMCDEIKAVVGEINNNSSIRVVILAASGKSFCAGGDLAWMRQQFDATREVRIAEAKRLANMLFALNTLEKPLIGKVQGNAFGGGIGMMSVCDVVVAVEGAKFGLTETKLGLIPATISPYVLARMGEDRARRVFMSARLFDTQEAMALNLVAKSCPTEELDAAVETEVLPYLQTAPGAVARAKQLARSLGPKIDEQVIDFTVNQLADCWEDPEAHEGISAFFDKRKASWVK
ncbi:crotonase/enoyl-CoA hydratase family protein [Maritalea porphyrae]|uniref:Enoyl-CoA hydratase n=1 Tax=Maritalea porphyrae TaxID=880732 RepID=A0ABQ5UR18_9HYPH|nr:crotonase/enoyl-CoA hydratase family protein [Maritalea porphyrae]GLQ17048.1 enoyl-CoA hydratase [Maritalea porphyrae]